MVGYNSDDNALTLGDDDSLKVGDYEVEYSADSDEFQARYGRPIGGELGDHGEIIGASYSLDSQIGNNSIEFDDLTDRVKLPQGTIDSTSDHTITLFVNQKEIRNRFVRFINTNDNTDGLRIFQSDDDNELRYTLEDSDTSNRAVTTIPPLDQYVHIAARLSGTDMELFIDGSSVATATGSSGGDPLEPTIGSRNKDSKESPIGVIDDVRIYDTALSNSQISDISNGVNVTDGLVARYDFEYPETPDVAIDSTGDAFPKNSIPRATSGSLVPQGLAESVSAGEALADDGNTYETVQAAVDAASGWVFVGPGTFNESVTISTEGLTLEGCGYDTTIDSSGDAVTITSENVNILNISIVSDEENSIKVDSNGCTFKKVYAKSGKHGIYIEGDKTTVSNCYIEESGKGVYIRSNSNNCIISNNTINNTLDSLTSYPHSIEIDSGMSNIISNNIVMDSDESGIRIDDSDNVVIGNRVDNSNNRGIEITSSGNDNIVANNRVSDSDGDDILDNGAGTVLDDNLTGPSN